MNTYGLHSINSATFNPRYHESINYPRDARNVVVSVLRMHNAALNVLGYIKGTSKISGCIRLGTGFSMFCAAILVGDPSTREGVIIGRWYNETIQTCLTQMARGILEAFVPYGKIVNAILDVIATPFNVTTAVKDSFNCEDCNSGRGSHVRPHDDAEYPFPLSILYLV